jgi:hypothetical protein
MISRARVHARARKGAADRGPHGFYETSVSEYGAGALVFFDCYTFKF